MTIVPNVFAITAVAILSAAAGIWLTSLPAVARRLAPFGGGALIGVALFWVLPEMAQFFRWSGALLWTLGGFALLAAIDRFVYPVCPACSPAHDHQHCANRLHGFATPLLAAAALHALLDGWSAAAGESARLSLGLLAGIAAHKIPEGLALAVIARAALASRAAALLWCMAAQLATPLGSALEAVLEPYLGALALHVLLALAGGSFLYLGGHAVHSEFRRSGPTPAFWPALTAVAGSSVLRLLIR